MNGTPSNANETVDSSNADVLTADNEVQSPGSRPLDTVESTINGTPSNENDPVRNEQVSESRITQCTTRLSRSTRSRRPPERFGDWVSGDDTEEETDIS